MSKLQEVRLNSVTTRYLNQINKVEEEIKSTYRIPKIMILDPRSLKRNSIDQVLKKTIIKDLKVGVRRRWVMTVRTTRGTWVFHNKLGK